MTEHADPVRRHADVEFVRLEAADTVGTARGRLEGSGVGVLTLGGEIAALVSPAKLAGLDEGVALADVVERLSPAVMVPGDLSVGEALAYPALNVVDLEAPGILVSDGDAIRLWSGPSLVQATFAFGSTRSVDSMIHGTIDVPHIVRLCGYTQGDDPCRDRRTFPERPDQDAMPACRNPKQLAPHRFKW